MAAARACAQDVIAPSKLSNGLCLARYVHVDRGKHENNEMVDVYAAWNRIDDANGGNFNYLGAS